jgi:hypothetical protein
MPLSFSQAKAIVSPGSLVTPGSQEHKDILEMMKQSGRIFPEDNIAIPPAPLGRVRELAELLPWRERKMPEPKPKAVSKRDWLSVHTNRVAYEEHIVKNQPVPVGYYEPEPAHHAWKGKKCTNWKGQSKREWIASLKENNSGSEYKEDGTIRRAEIQTTGEAEGRTGASQEDA